MKKVWMALLIVAAALLAAGCDDLDRDVTISLPSGQYYGEQRVTITCEDPTAQITYTLDGSDPGESVLVYDSETGITVSYTSDLKATAGTNVAEAHYDITPYSAVKDAAAQALFNAAQGSYATDQSRQDTFVLRNSTVTFQAPGQPEASSGYVLTDVNGNNATLIYTDAQGSNQRVPFVYDPVNATVTINGKVYTNEWTLDAQAEEQEYYDYDEDYY